MQIVAKIVLVSVFLLTSNGYPSEKFDTWCSSWSCPTSWCLNTQCQETRPEDRGGDWRWAKGKFTCSKAWVKSYPFSMWCKCEQCQRDCQLDEIYNTNACDIADIPTIKNDVAGKIQGVIVDTLVDGAIGVLDTYTGGLIGFGKSIFDATGDDNTLLNSVIDEANKRTRQLVACMGEKISELDADEVADDMQAAFVSYEFAEEYEHHPSETKTHRDRVENAWEDFYTTVTSEFGPDDLDGKPIYFKKNLALVQNFASLFALTTIDYLLILKRDGDTFNFHKNLGKSLDAFDNLRDWAYTAQKTIVDDMWVNIGKKPCRNDNSLEREVEAWKERFEIANIDPIEQYIAKLNDLSHKSPIGEGNECKNAPSIKVLSVDHKNGELGQYFNFNVEDVTRMLGGRTDWNGKTFTVRNRRDGATERVIVWRQPNGGSIGNAHGRRDPHKYSSGNDWKVGDELVYRPGDYSACADEFECRADTSCLKKKKDFGCWQIKDRETCLSSKDGRAYHGHLNDACVWCGGARCTTNNDNKCEPQTWLLSRSNQVEPNKYEYASDSCRSSCLHQQKDLGCWQIKDRDTCLSSKDGRFAHMSDPCVWCGGARCTTNNANKCEPQTWLLARDNQVEPDKYEYAENSCKTTSMTCQACADGYYPQEGDIPGLGMGGQSVSSCQACAELCTANDKCHSFECSATELWCNLNEQADPSVGKYKDFMFCTKEE